LATQLDAIGVNVHLETTISIISIYIPPGTIDTVDKAKETAKEIKDLLNQLDKPYLVMGDFNAHSEAWGSLKETPFGRELLERLEEADSHILNTGENTHFCLASGTESAIDLTLATPDLVPELEWFVQDDLHDSDHYPIITRFWKASPRATKRPRWILSTAKWDEYRKGVGEVLSRCNDSTNINQITEAILPSAAKNIKRSKETISDKKLKWMTPEIRELIKNRRKAERKLKKPHTIDDVIEFKRLKAKVRLEIKTARKKCWHEFTNTITHQTPTQIIWRKISKINGRYRTPGIRQIKGPDGEIHTNPKKIANALADHFSNNSSTNKYHPSFKEIKQQSESREITIDLNHLADYNEEFTEEEFDFALNECKGSSPGPDQIEYDLIKQLNRDTQQKILTAFNRIWKDGTFPAEWQTATVVAVPKPGKDPEKVDSYHPIALTSCLCKLMERIVNKRLVWFLEQNSCIREEQFGFRKGRSTIDVMATLEAEGCRAIHNKEFMALCSLDLSCAYDQCWRYGILRNLKKIKINGRLLAYTNNFMSSRSIRVAVGNTYSEEREIENGVPQGAVISVTLFLIAINDIAQSNSKLSKMIGYADDWVCG
jgi:Reverse transcriptase (RNA-dependent DNA polymerase)/Endonuclease-reverse transcriptase